MASDSRQSGGMEDESRKEPIDTKATTTEDPQTSDNDGGERPIRAKLKETSITSAPQDSTANESAKPTSADVSAKEEKEGDSRASSRGRKRSFGEEDEDMENNDDEAGHRRKRSRDSNYEENNQGSPSDKPQKTDDVERKILSPKKKRSRDQLDKEEPKIVGVAGRAVLKEMPEDGASTEKSPTEGEPEKKRHRDDSQERDPAPIKSVFSNTSAVSPFGSFGSPKKKEEPPKHVTSNSAFAASSLAAFSGSEQSPFGSIGGTTASVFKSPATEGEKPALTSFAATEGASPFATGSSGFASLGSGGSGFSAFSSGFGGGAAPAKPLGGLTSFASPGPSSLTSTSKVKAFGAPEDEEENNEDEADAGPKEFEEDKTDERFFEREIETGEEEEKTYFSCKAKLFQFSDKEWRERGIGTFKVNVKVKDGKEDKKAARLIMRADGVLRVMLNTPIFKGMTVGDASGNEPKSKQIHLASLENDRSVPILLRTGNDDLAKELYHVVKDLLEEL